MNFLFPILAAILQAGSFTLDKVVLSIRRVNFKTYTGVSFPLIFLITLVIFFIFRPPLSLDLLAGNLRWLLLISVGMTIVTNLIFYRALDDDKLGEIQTLDLLHSIPIIIFASVFFADERNFFCNYSIPHCFFGGYLVSLGALSLQNCKTYLTLSRLVSFCSANRRIYFKSSFGELESHFS